MNERYAGMTPQEVGLLPEPASELQGLIARSVIDLMDQESKVARSGLTDLFERVDRAAPDLTDAGRRARALR